MAKQEDDLIAAFRKLSREQQSLYFDSICECAKERERTAPALRLVSGSAVPSFARRLYGGSENA